MTSTPAWEQVGYLRESIRIALDYLDDPDCEAGQYLQLVELARDTLARALDDGVDKPAGAA